jgi:hypothetical protein
LPTLPKNNKEAVSSVLSREEQLINDAIEELEEVCIPSLSYFSNVIFSTVFCRLQMHQSMTKKLIPTMKQQFAVLGLNFILQSEVL